MIAILVVLLILAIPIAAVLPALLNRSSIAQDHRSSFNTDIAIERMEEVTHIDGHERLEAEDEIKSHLLEDTRSKEVIADKIISIRYSLWIPVFLIGLSIGLYVELGAPSLMFNSSRTVQKDSSLSPRNIDAMIGQLEEKIKQNPNDIEALQIAGQVYATIGNTSKAESTYRRLNDLSPGNPDYLTGLANAVILNNQDAYTKEAETLIGQALAIDPQHQNALWISALGASSRGEIEQSIRQLETLLSLVQNESEVRQSLLSMIEQQRALLNNASISEEPPDGKLIAVEVVLGDGLADQLADSDTVFVIAKAMKGPPAPLAVRKLAVGDLPSTLSLSRAHAMIEGMTIDDFEEIEIQARVSRNATTQAAPGDLVSDSKMISGKQEAPTTLLINKVLD